MSEELPPAPFRLIPVKFVGGLLAIGTGLALGREGPQRANGGQPGPSAGRVFRRNRPDCRMLLAAGAGAGLATAFNAPIAGAVFVLEELVRRFDTRMTIATLGASAGAIAVARVLLGDAPDFQVEPLPYPGFGTVPIHLALGVVAGVLGVAYNRTLLGTLAAAERLRRWPVELRAALVGAAVGLLAWLPRAWSAVVTRSPSARSLAQRVSPCWRSCSCSGSASGPCPTRRGHRAGCLRPCWSWGRRAVCSLGLFCNHWFPTLAPHPTALAVVGMAAFFTAVVRAPLTGIILVTEMTASFTLLLPMLGACFAAMAGADPAAPGAHL